MAGKGRELEGALEPGKVRAGMQREQKGGWGHWGWAKERLMQMEAF